MDGTQYWSQDQSTTRMLAGNPGAGEIHEMSSGSAQHSANDTSSNSESKNNSNNNIAKDPGNYVTAGEGTWNRMQDPHCSNSPVFGAEIRHTGSGQHGNAYQYTGAHNYSPNIIPSQPDSQRELAFHSITPQPSISTMGHPSPEFMEFDDSTQKHTPADLFSSSFSAHERAAHHSRTDSDSHLLPSKADGAVTSWRGLSSSSLPPYTSNLPVRKKWWHWRPAWCMYIFLLFGFCAALSHHLFYSSLNNQIAVDQLKMLRYGTAVAFAAKACFVAAVVTAFRQRLWITLRKKLLSVGSVDSLFAATDDITALFNIETYQKAKLAMLLALIIWLTPLIIILTCNTLLVAPFLNVYETQCPNIRTLNFTGDELEDFRNPTVIDGKTAIPVNLWNTTMLKDENSPNWWDYYTGVCPYFTAAASLGIYSHQAIGVKSASLEICGAGWNCTYTINFIGPGYKCKELASDAGHDVEQMGDNVPPFNTSILLPKGNYSYYIQGTLGDYNPEQMERLATGGHPPTGPPYPPHLGAMRLEPIIWAGYAVRVNQDPKVQPPNTPSDPGWDDAYIPKIFACEHYETAYTVVFNYTGQDQFTNVVKREFLYPVMNTTYDPNTMANDGTRDNTTATPESNYVLPYPMSNITNLRRYRRVSTFHTMGSVLRNAINGTMLSNPVNIPNAVTNALQTKVLNPAQMYFPYPNLQDLVQELYEDIILSMFSNKRFVSLAWAAKPWQIAGDIHSDESQLYPCTKSRWENRYVYVVRDLWIVYSCAFFCAAVAVALGTLAVLENEGRLYDTRFSSIVAATRGPGLEKVLWSHGDLAPEVKSLKVGYGVTFSANSPGMPQDARRPESRELRYGFGLEGDVQQDRRESIIFRGRTL